MEKNTLECGVGEVSFASHRRTQSGLNVSCLRLDQEPALEAVAWCTPTRRRPDKSSSIISRVSTLTDLEEDLASDLVSAMDENTRLLFSDSFLQGPSPIARQGPFCEATQATEVPCKATQTTDVSFTRSPIVRENPKRHHEATTTSIREHVCSLCPLC